MPVGSQQGRNVNESNIVRQGLASAAAEDGAISGDAATIGSDGKLLFAPRGQEIDYVQIVVAAPVTDTSEATGTALITSNSIEYDGDTVIVEFYCWIVQSPSNAAGDFVRISLWEGSTQIARIGYARTYVAGQVGRVTVLAHHRFTPSAGNHQYKIAAHANTLVGSPTLFAGPGGPIADPPAYISIRKA